MYVDGIGFGENCPLNRKTIQGDVPFDLSSLTMDDYWFIQVSGLKHHLLQKMMLFVDGVFRNSLHIVNPYFPYSHYPIHSGQRSELCHIPWIFVFCTPWMETHCEVPGTWRELIQLCAKWKHGRESITGNDDISIDIHISGM